MNTTLLLKKILVSDCLVRCCPRIFIKFHETILLLQSYSNILLRGSFFVSYLENYVPQDCKMHPVQIYIYIYIHLHTTKIYKNQWNCYFLFNHCHFFRNNSTQPTRVLHSREVKRYLTVGPTRPFNMAHLITTHHLDSSCRNINNLDKNVCWCVKLALYRE